MTALLTVDEVREHLETDLGTTALQRLIDDADAAIVDRFGPNPDSNGEIELVITGGSGQYGMGGWHNGRLLFLDRPVASQEDVSALVEIDGKVQRDVGPDQYRILHYGRTLERIGTSGGYWGWGSRVRIAYKPTTDTARRARVLLDLVRLASEYRAVKALAVGDLNEDPVDYQAEREKILGELSPALVG